ncbi:hypothetical protein CONCODRAFT_14504 [Conidiobolus coronatus NRRL 28638]|uniref:Pentacotripeptide-repeat region of PRORP domain-containing protein n=1 Tax=Conidiobolus coronatus (strain ATCC 28846 / CBS 209.66 / NRRL 28638) TaxID=796925 RepID=A0A137PIX4_CONC2|nr:hypothetical protein CONCODRAFT_14504 [Conidiobolus coronatus NRRL 28638]|eukprot:KXN74958.1 hypothetical protein CONCODRAFT_14504 [Conidiobolus coronatus NRRL 28638]
MNRILRSTKYSLNISIIFRRYIHEPTLPSIPSSISIPNTQQNLALSATHPDFTDSKTLLHKRITNLLLSNHLDGAFDLLEAYSLHPNPQMDSLTLILVGQYCLKNSSVKKGEKVGLNSYNQIQKLIEYSNVFKLSCEPALQDLLMKAYLKLPDNLKPKELPIAYINDLETCHFFLRKMIKTGQFREASKLFRRVRLGKFKFYPNALTFSIMIHMNVIQQQWTYALKFLHYMREAGITPTPVIYNQIILLLARCGEEEQALMYLEQMKSEFNLIPLKQTYQYLILHFSGYDSENPIIKKLRNELIERYTLPSKSYYVQLVRNHCKLQEYEHLKETLGELYQIYPNEKHFFIIKILLSHLIENKMYDEAKALFEDAVDRGYVVPSYYEKEINELLNN